MLMSETVYPVTMSESDFEVNKLIKELELKNQSQVRVNSIADLKLECKDNPELISKFIDALVIHLKTEKPVESDAVHKAFVAVFHQNKEASLSAVLKHLTVLKVPPPKEKRLLSYTEEVELHKIHLTKTRIAELIEKSLEKETTEELQQLAEILEGNAGLDAFDVSDTDCFDRFISCLQMAVPFFARGAPWRKVLELVNDHILLNFDKLPEQRKLDFIRALAEISSHTTAQVASQMLPSVVVLLKKDIPDTEEFMSFTYVECLLYMLHHLAHKAPDVATDLCNKDFMLSLTSISTITQARMEKLAKTLPEDVKLVWEAEKHDMRHEHLRKFKLVSETRRQQTKTGIRSCTNILAITELQLSKKKQPFFIEDYIVKLSWKEAKKALPSGISSISKYSKVRDRSAALESVSKECKQDLDEVGICNLNEKQLVKLLGLSKYRQVSRNRKGPWVLNDSDGIAMLCSRIKESDLNLVKNIGKKGRTGDVRDQMFHLLCWTYAASDLVSFERSESCVPLCPWYLCSFCEPEKLGNDIRAEKPLGDKRIHHCYGSSIESALRHIQKNGVPRETVSEFDCTDHQPPSADEPWLERRRIKHSRTINSLEDALKEIEKRPIGADLLHYTGMMESGAHIYYGPTGPNSHFYGYHAVVIEEVKQIDNEWVAVCKSSNGDLVGDYGYVNVSLATQYIPVGVSAEKSRFVRGSEEPMHLLTDFIVAEMDKNETEDDENEDGKDEDKKKDSKEDDENEDGKDEDKKKDSKEDKKPSDEEPEEDYEEYIPKSKRGPASAPKPKRGRPFYVGMLGIEDPITGTGSDAVDVIEDAITHHNKDSTTKAMALVALPKLSSHFHFPSISERIKDMIVKQKRSFLLEMQQRATEYNFIVDRHKDIRSSIVERMPVLDEATFNVRRAGSFSSTMAKPSVGLPNGVEKPAVTPLVDLLDLDSDDILAARSSSGADFLQDLLGVDLGSSSAQYGATQAPKAGTDPLLNILSIGTPSPVQNSISSIDLLSTTDVNNNPSIALDTLSSPAPPHVATTSSTGMFELLDGLFPSPSKEATNGPAYPPITAYESSSLKIEFTFSKPPGNPQATNVQVTFINLSSNTFTDLIFQAAVPKFLQLHLDPASSNTLLASGNGLIIENLRVTNSQHGKVWCIGEYGDLLDNNVGILGIEDPMTVTESDAVDAIEDAITRHNSDLAAKAMALAALLKLSSHFHFPSISDSTQDAYAS